MTASASSRDPTLAALIYKISTEYTIGPNAYESYETCFVELVSEMHSLQLVHIMQPGERKPASRTRTELVKTFMRTDTHKHYALTGGSSGKSEGRRPREDKLTV